MSNTINLCIVFLIYIFLAFFCYQVFKVTSEESLVMAATFVMLGVFGAGLVGNLKCVYYVAVIIDVLGVGLTAIKYLLGYEKKIIYRQFTSFFSPSIVILILLFFYAFIAFKGAIYTYPDEIFQWGPAVKYMVEKGQLPYGANFTGQAVTFSMTTMFQYFWSGLTNFVERNSMVANFILSFIPIFLPFSGSGWKEWKKIAIYTILIFLAINIVTYVKYYTLLQDIVLPMWAGGVIGWLLWKKKEKINWIIILCSLACISSMKSLVGPLFSGIIVLVVIIYELIYYTPKRVGDIVSINTIKCSIAIILCIFGISGVWSYVIGTNVHNRFITYDAEAKNIFDIIRGIINGSFSNLNSSVKAIPNVSYFIFGGLIVIFLLLFSKYCVDIKEKIYFKVTICFYLIGFLCYLIVMLYAYIRVFSASDSQSVAGLDRYLSYYILLGIVPVTSFFFVRENSNNKKSLYKIKILIFLMLLYGTENDFVTKVSAINIKNDSIYILRSKIENQCLALNELIESEDKVFVLGVLSSNEYKIMAYEIGNQFAGSEDCYAVYNRNIKDTILINDVLTYPTLLENYKYDVIWLYNIEDNDKLNAFKYNYGIADVRNGSVYRVVRNSEQYELEYIGNTEEE